jgi:hypothetical protein
MTTQFDVTMAGEIHLDLILHGLPENAPLDPVIRGANFQATQGSSSATLAHRLLLLGVGVGLCSASAVTSLEELRFIGLGNRNIPQCELPGLVSARPRICRAETSKSSLIHQATQKQERIFRA